MDDINRMDFKEYCEYRHRVTERLLLADIQRRYNAALSAQVEMIEAARADAAWLGWKPTPWYRFDIRLRNWMGMWDSRFASRYHR